jgi:transcriptional regulator with XRE-family HTH domain
VDDGILQTTIGKEARKARDALGLTQAQVAEQAGLSGQVYGRIERGHMIPSVGTLVRIAVALCTDVNVLLGMKRDGSTSEAGHSPEVRRAVALMSGWPAPKVKAGCDLLRVLDGVPVREE